MPAELRDAQDGWGQTQAEYARREKLRMRDRMKKRQQRARMKMTPPPLELSTACAAPRFETFTLKGLDVQELGIVAVLTKVQKLANPMSGIHAPKMMRMSLPFVSMIHGPFSNRRGERA